MPKPLLRIRGGAGSRGAPARRLALCPAAPAALAPVLFLLLTLGCGTEEFKPSAPVDPTEAYWALALNHHAVTLGRQAPYDTLTLVAVPRTATEVPLAGPPAPVYISRDPTRIAVTPDGVLHTIDVAVEPVWVIATLTVDNVTHADSVRVRAVDVTDPPVVGTFLIQPTPDSAKISVDFHVPQPLLTVHATDTHGEPISDLIVAFQSSKPGVAKIDPVTGVIQPSWPGDVTLSASATVFGVAKEDSVLFRVGAPIFRDIAMDEPASGTGPTAEFPTLTLGVGALVMWAASPSDSSAFSIDFDNIDLPKIAPASAFSGYMAMSFFCGFLAADCSDTGNITTAPPAIRSAFRVFTVPGIYDYRCTTCGRSGRIIVVDESRP